MRDRTTSSATAGFRALEPHCVTWSEAAKNMLYTNSDPRQYRRPGSAIEIKVFIRHFKPNAFIMYWKMKSQTNIMPHGGNLFKFFK